MDNNKYDPNDPRIQLVLAKQQIKFTKELNTLQTQLDLKKQELKFMQEAINRSIRKTAKKKGKAKFLAFLASIIFLLSTVFTSLGINIITSASPKSLDGVYVIIAGVAFYLIGAYMTFLLPREENA